MTCALCPCPECVSRRILEQSYRPRIAERSPGGPDCLLYFESEGDGVAAGASVVLRAEPDRPCRPRSLFAEDARELFLESFIVDGYDHVADMGPKPIPLSALEAARFSLRTARVGRDIRLGVRTAENRAVAPVRIVLVAEEAPF